MAERVLEIGLPADTESERLVLGSIAVGSDFGLVASALSETDFSLEKHRRIFARMRDLYDRGEPIDRVTLARELMDRGQLESVDGMTYLVSLDEGMPQIANIDAYVNIIREKSVQRRAIFTCQRAIDELVGHGAPTGEILARCERMISDLAGDTVPSGLLSVMETIAAHGGPNGFIEPSARRKGIETPWGRLNQSLEGGGLLPGQMVVIGGRPGTGKTAIACNIALRAALDGHGTALFSLEMSDDAIIRRIAGAHARVDQMRYSQGRGSAEDRALLESAYGELLDPEICKLWIASRCYTVPSIRAALVKFVARNPISLVVIDYLQLIETSGGGEKRRVEQMSEISRQIKRLAEEFRVPVVALSQLNREMEREQRMPRASDLRESGSLEQDADLILMPYVLPERDQPGGAIGDTPLVDLLIVKQRNGAVGRIPLVFRKRFTLYEER